MNFKYYKMNFKYYKISIFRNILSLGVILSIYFEREIKWCKKYKRIWYRTILAK